MKTLLPLLVLALSFSACGKLKPSQRKANTKTWSATTSQALTAEQFKDFCDAKAGRLDAAGNICIYSAAPYLIGKGLRVVSDGYSHEPMFSIASGTAVQAFGTITSGAVKILLNGVVLTEPRPNPQPITTNGGALSFQLQPGTLEGVRIYVYTCVGRSQQAVRCPF